MYEITLQYTHCRGDLACSIVDIVQRFYEPNMAKTFTLTLDFDFLASFSRDHVVLRDR